MQIIGLCGKAGTGKDTIGEYLFNNYGFSVRSIASPIKVLCKDLFGLSKEQLWGDKKEEIDFRYGKTPREILQMVGEGMRRINENVWIDLVLNSLEEDRKYVITDVRYLNEIYALKKMGGLVWRIYRGEGGLSGRESNHPSEMEMDCYSGWDKRIWNDGTIQDLVSKVEKGLPEWATLK